MTDKHDETRCPYCGASLKKYWHRVTPLLVDALVKFRAAVVSKNENCVHLVHDMNDTPNELTHNERNNFTKLRFHGLVTKYKEDGDHKAGYWLITKRGALFLNGRLDIPYRVQTWRNKVVDHSERKIFVREVRSDVPYVEALGDIDYDLKEVDFNETGQGGLF